MTCRTLETFYHINAHTFEKLYKETLGGFRGWDQLDHADSWLLFPENIGPHLAIDESSLSNGELCTFVTNRDRHTGEESLVAVVSGTSFQHPCPCENNCGNKRYKPKSTTRLPCCGTAQKQK